ncbi:MAG: cytochrome c nitrite reductase small subunit, partial [Bacteroidota bacterium]
IREAGATVVQENCIRCHRDAVENTSLIEMNGQADSKGKPCWDCHREVPHGSRTSLSSSPFGLIPQKGDNNVPEWLMKSIKNK